MLLRTINELLEMDWFSQSYHIKLRTGHANI